MSGSPSQALLQLLERWQPRSLLVLSASPVPALAPYQKTHDLALTTVTEPGGVTALPPPRRFDGVLVADWLEHLSRTEGEALLGTLRNLYSDQVLVLFQPSQATESWPLTAFYALGLLHRASFEQENPPSRRLLLFSYDLAHYNHERTWNNPRHWANPELWGKYWW